LIMFCFDGTRDFLRKFFSRSSALLVPTNGTMQLVSVGRWCEAGGVGYFVRGMLMISSWNELDAELTETKSGDVTFGCLLFKNVEMTL